MSKNTFQLHTVHNKKRGFRPLFLW